MSDDIDIVTLLRAWSMGAAEQGVAEVTDGLLAAADEIERLRKERDEARRAVCCSALPSDYKEWKPGDVDAAVRLIAAQQGWDCFKEVKP